jgi:hypothetical protein
MTAVLVLALVVALVGAGPLGAGALVALLVALGTAVLAAGVLMALVLTTGALLPGSVRRPVLGRWRAR